MGLRQWYSYSVFGIPHGPLGWIGARMMASMKGKYYRSMAAELDLQAEDELLDVGCGSGRLFVEHAGDDSKALVGRTDKSGTRDAWGLWRWTDADAQRLVEEAGFTDVSVSVLPVLSKSQLVQAVRPASTVAANGPESADLVGEPVA